MNKKFVWWLSAFAKKVNTKCLENNTKIHDN